MLKNSISAAFECDSEIGDLQTSDRASQRTIRREMARCRENRDRLLKRDIEARTDA
jgi:hypothetical protein